MTTMTLSALPILPTNPGGAPPPSWTNQLVASVKAPINFSGLTPGTTYAFQARALVKDKYTDWSDSVTFMST